MFIKSFVACEYNIKQHLHELVETNKTDTREFILLNLQLIIIKQMAKYIAYGNWGGVKVRETFMFYVKTNYDIAQTAQRYALTDNAIQDLIKKADTAIAKKLDKPLRQILSGYVYEGATAFYINTMKVEKNRKKN